MSGGEFDWGGRLRKGIGGAQRFPQRTNPAIPVLIPFIFLYSSLINLCFFPINRNSSDKLTCLNYYHKSTYAKNTLQLIATPPRQLSDSCEGACSTGAIYSGSVYDGSVYSGSVYTGSVYSGSA